MFTLSRRYLELERDANRGTGGISAENRHLGFIPAFKDTRTGKVYASTYMDGQLSPFHVLDGLPDELVVARDRHGRPSHVVGSIITGFLRNSCFYTRAQTAAQVLRAAAPAEVFAH